MPHAAFGDLTTPEIELYHYRYRFLEELNVLYPEALEQLRERVLPQYSKRAELADDYREQAKSSRLIGLEYEPTSWAYVRRAGSANGRIAPHLEPLHSSLLEWSQPFGLAEDNFYTPVGFQDHLLDRHIAQPCWAMNVAIETLASWERASPICELTWGNTEIYDSSPPSGLPPLPEYLPGFDSSASFNEKMETWKRSLRASYREAGWTTPSEKRNMEHFTWLVLRHTGKFGVSHLIESTGSCMDAPAMARMFREEAIHMGMRLSRLPNGRPSPVQAQQKKDDIKRRWEMRRNYGGGPALATAVVKVS